MGRDESVDDLVHRWQSLRQQGQSVTVEQLCADCPDAMPEVEERLRAVAEMMEFLDLTPGRGDTTTPPVAHPAPAVPSGEDESSIPPIRELRHERFQIGARLGEGGWASSTAPAIPATAATSRSRS